MTSALELLIWLAKNPNRHLPKTLELKMIDWDVFLEFAHLNRIIPFTWHILWCEKCCHKIPSKTLIQLQGIYLFSKAQWKIQVKEQEKISHLLFEREILNIPIKDYRCYGLRYPRFIFPEKFDIDFFVPEEEYWFVDQTMLLANYKPKVFPFPKDKFALLERDYVKKMNKSLLVNFHFKDILPETEGKVNPLNPKIVKHFSKIFIKSIKRDKDGIFLPSLELNFIFVCLHFFFRDRFAGLRTLYEISQHLGQFNEKINWDYTFKITREMKVESYFLFVIKIASLVFDVKLPEKIRRRVSYVRSINIALKFYFPILSALTPTLEELSNPKINNSLAAYRFFIKLILWQKPFYRKIGPRTILFFLIYFLPIYLRLRKKCLRFD